MLYSAVATYVLTSLDCSSFSFLRLNVEAAVMQEVEVEVEVD